MPNLVQVGKAFTYTSRYGTELKLNMTSHKFIRDLGYLKQDYSHEGVEIVAGDDAFVLRITNPEEPNCEQDLIYTTQTIHRLLNLGVFTKVERLSPSHPVVTLIEDLFIMLGLQSKDHLLDTYTRIPFANGDWEYLSDDGYVYTLTRKFNGSNYFTQYTRTYNAPYAPLEDGQSLEIETTQHRRFFSTHGTPVTIEQAIAYFDL